MSNFITDIPILQSTAEVTPQDIRTTPTTQTGQPRKLYIESYGCQMNFSDSEIVASILQKEGFDTTSDENNADVIFLNTCSIREKAEQTVRSRLAQINNLKKKTGIDCRCAGLHGRAVEDLVAGGRKDR